MKSIIKAIEKRMRKMQNRDEIYAAWAKFFQAVDCEDEEVMFTALSEVRRLNRSSGRRS